MGFTHYWTRKVIELNKVKWKKFIEDIGKVMKNMPNHFEGDGGDYTQPIEICGGNGKGKPIFNMEEVCFNGKQCDEDLAHETFHIPRVYDFGKDNISYKKDYWKKSKEIFDFCKTARKPYSFLAEVVLLLVQYHFNEQMNISSDGDGQDWKFAKDYFGKIFPKYAVVLRLED